MKSFFKIMFASTLGMIFGAIVLSILSVFAFIAIAASSGSSSYSPKDDTIFRLEIKGAVSDRATDSPFSKLFSNDNSYGLDDIISSIRKAKEQDKIKGIYLKLDAMNAGLSDLEPIRKALLDFRESGKFIVSYGDSYSQAGYVLASVADKIILNPEGAFDFHGIGMNKTYVKNMFDKIGIQYQLFKVGTYKSAVEPYIQDHMSGADRLQSQAFLDDIWGHLLKNISESRNIPVDTLNAYADQCLTFEQAENILSYKLVDTLLYAPAVDEYLKTLVKIDSTKDVNFASLSNMVSVESKEKKEKSKIAVLYAEGSITDEAGSGLFVSGSEITPDTYVKELNKLKDDKNVKAVVFRVNSPGGSAYASEQIWHAVKELKAKKPVIVSMGNYAASGGYYISCAADTIVAEPTTLTGSIGIFGLIPNGEELAKKMGYSFDGVGTNKHSLLGGQTFGIPFLLSAQSRPFSAEETAMLQKYIEQGYDLFLSRCADGRSMTKVEIDSIGQGRVWTGNQALQIGLVDVLGGLDTAVKIAAEKAGVEKYEVSNYPTQKDFFTELMEESLQNAKVKFVKAFMGTEEYERRQNEELLKNTGLRMAQMPERVSF